MKTNRIYTIFLCALASTQTLRASDSKHSKKRPRLEMVDSAPTSPSSRRMLKVHHEASPSASPGSFCEEVFSIRIERHEFLKNSSLLSKEDSSRKVLQKFCSPLKILDTPLGYPNANTIPTPQERLSVIFNQYVVPPVQ